MTYRVPIVDVTQQFHRAHEALVLSLGGAAHLSCTAPRRYWNVLEYNWKKKYNISPRNGSGSTAWKYLDFESEKHYTAFILRWS